jgi:hypothetical protein
MGPIRAAERVAPSGADSKARNKQQEKKQQEKGPAEWLGGAREGRRLLNGLAAQKSI